MTGLCVSMDGTWVFCTTDTGLLKVFKRGKPPRQKSKKKKNRQQGIKMQPRADWSPA